MSRSDAFAGVLPPQPWWKSVDALVSRFLVQIREPGSNGPREGLCMNQSGHSDVFISGERKTYALCLSDQFIQYVRGVRRSTMEHMPIREKARHIVGVLGENAWVVWGEKLLKVNCFLESLALTTLVFMDHVLVGRWDKELKYHLNCYFCRFTKTEYPEPIGSVHRAGTVFFGSLDRYIFRWVSKRNQKAWIYLNSILQGVKRGMPQLTVDRINETAIKHAEKLSKKHVTPGWLLDEITRTSREIWHGEVTQRFPDVATKVSGNSCLESNRRHGGALGYVLNEATEYGRNTWDEEDWENFEAEITNDTRIPHNWTHLVAMRFHPSVGVKEIRTDLLIDETLRMLRRGDQVWDSMWKDRSCVLKFFAERARAQGCGKTRNCKTVSSTLRGVPDYDWDLPCQKFGKNESRVKFILEPLKVRTITKSSLFSNALYPEVQKQLWRGLQSFPQFSLTGETMTERSLDDLVLGGAELFGNIYDLCSGDYSAATDNLHMDASLAALIGAIDDPTTFALVRDNMCGQRIDYTGAFGSKKFVPPESFEQKNGQLMGSLFSFPVLCVINLAVYRVAMEKHFKRKFEISELPVKVNGDDILFPTNVDFQRRWEGLIPQVGFSKSVGKNFVSNEFCMVNSMLFRRAEGLVHCLSKCGRYFEMVRRYKFVPFVNATALTGIKKGTDTEKDRDKSYNDRLWNLRGAFRDLDTERMPKSIGSRFVERVRARLDVQDSHFCDYELGLSSDLPKSTDQIRKYYFHQEAKKLHEEPNVTLNNHDLLRPGDRVLERFRQPDVRFDISRAWTKFNSNQVKAWPTSFEIVRDHVKRLLKNDRVRALARAAV